MNASLNHLSILFGGYVFLPKVDMGSIPEIGHAQLQTNPNEADNLTFNERSYNIEVFG